MALGVIPWDVLHQGLTRQPGVGMGTVLYALAIGPLVQVLMPRLSVRLHR